MRTLVGLLGAGALAALLVFGLYINIKMTFSIRTYNAMDADLVHKVEAAVTERIPSEEIEGFVGMTATFNTWRTDPTWTLHRVNIYADSGVGESVIPIHSAARVMVWRRPVDSERSYPLMVGIMWDESGRATVFAGTWH